MNLTIAQDQAYQGNEFWKWSVWIEGPGEELDQIKEVRYRLHPSLPNPVRMIADRGSKFRLEAESWGLFTIHLKLLFNDDRVLRLEHNLAGRMGGPHFISYSQVDGRDFAVRLADALRVGPQPFRVWFDVAETRAKLDWDEAIRSCETPLFVVTPDSLQRNLTCKQEWTRALRYKKPVIPLFFSPDMSTLPMDLRSRQGISFYEGFERGVAQLRDHLAWRSSPAGVLQTLKERLADAERDLTDTTDPVQHGRIQKEIEELTQQIDEQQLIVADPRAAEQRVEDKIARGLEREREPAQPVSAGAPSKSVNLPPGVVPAYFQNRQSEISLLAKYLREEAVRLIAVIGPDGVGKTAMICRVLKSLERDELPEDGGPLSVDGIIYLGATGSHGINVPNLFAGLCKRLSEKDVRRFEVLCRDAQASTEAKMQALLNAFPDGRTIVLLDGFEQVVNPQTLLMDDTELAQALRTLLTAPRHGIKLILTTRIEPQDLAVIEPERQVRLGLEEGLPLPDAENMLHAMDADGRAGLKAAPSGLLTRACARTRGNPRALEALFAILSTDPHTSLKDLLADPSKLVAGNFSQTLVEEAFSRLDSTEQKVTR